MTYGTGPPTITPSYSGFVNGDDASSLSTAPVCSTTATAASHVGSYPTSCSGASDSNYAITYSNGSVSVVPAPLTITASSGMTSYGSNPPSVSPIVTGLQNGESTAVLGGALTCVSAATASSTVGTFATSCSGASDPDYAITYVTGTTTIIPAPLTITATSGTMTYGGAVPTISPIVSGLENGENTAVLGAGLVCTTTATPTSSVGDYPSSCSGAVDANYDISYVAGTVSVTPAALTITASSNSMTYGDPVPTITPIVSGLQNGETAAVLGAGLVCTTGADTTSPVGSYASACGGAVDSNYAISYVTGTVTVNPATLMITASSSTVDYGDAPPAITASYSGFVNGDTAASLTTPPTCSTTATSSSPVGSYGSSCSGAVDAELRHQLPGRLRPGRGRHRRRDSLVGRHDLRRDDPGHLSLVLGLRERGHRRLAHHAANVLDHGHVVEPGGQLRQLVLGGGRPQLRVQLRGGLGADQPGTAHRGRLSRSR